ncbi:MAG: hypothetical protein MRJ93_12905 [Nitrososphaeraceae archaeon]|nr:hypothetical protein [Nitrososphaeraceae archaeon]
MNRLVIITIVIMMIISSSNNISFGAEKQDNATDKINAVIGEGLVYCSTMDNDSCIGVMHTLDNICQVVYFENCFGPLWDKFGDYMKDQIEKGHYPDEKYEQDPYFTLNNHHYRNSNWSKSD